MLKLSSHERAQWRSKAHHLDPVVMISSNGLTDSVLKEIDVNLNAHGLIKIRVFSDDKDERLLLSQTICKKLHAAPIQRIGKLLVIYRPKQEKVKKPNAPGGLKTVTTFKSGTGSIKNRVKKVQIKGNERVTAGGLVKRKKVRQASLKKKFLSNA